MVLGLRDAGTPTLTAAPPHLSRVFEPLRIGPVVIPNRVARTGHLTKFALGSVTDDLIAYHVARARSGVGLTVLEACAVHPSSVLGMTGFDDSVIPGYRRLMDAVRPHGMRVFQQLWHGGHVYNAPDGAPPRGASALASPVSGIPAVPLSVTEIAEMVEAYAAAARRAVEGGIEGVEVHAGHGYLLQQFLSPLTNTREDAYGGSLDARMRFLVEVLVAVRASVGADTAVGIRVGAGQVKGDISEAEVAEVSRRVVGQGLVDYVNVTMGDYYAMHWMMGGMDRPAGYMLDSSGQVTAAVSGVPRLVTGRFRTLEEVEQVLRGGVADIVSMVRAHIADPDLVRKTREGRAHEVRPCIACNQGCIARTAGRDQRMACTVNPAVGYELTLAEDLIGVTAHPRRVVVVGGGPAGMEAARTARLRGHEVILFEAYPTLGGTLNVLRKAPMMQGFEDIADWHRQEIDRLGVEVRTGVHVDADDVLTEHPDAVIVATGAEPVLDGRLVTAPGEPVVGIGLAHVLTSLEVLTGARTELGTTALVVDDLASYEAVAVAEFLLHRGVAVRVATCHPAFGGLVEAAMRMEPALARLHAVGPTFTVHTRSQLLQVRPGTAVLRDGIDGCLHTVPADTVVIVTHRRARRELADRLSGCVPSVQLVGDALSARDLQVAIREGHMAGRQID